MIMKSKRLFLMPLYCSLFLMLCYLGLSFAEDKADLTIYSNGKKMGSLHEYKLSMLRNKVLDSIPPGQDDQFKEFIKRFSENLSYENSKEYSENDLKILFQGIHKSLVNKEIQSPKSEDLDKMQEMLEDYNKDYNKSGTYVIDPEKVKTLIIEPSLNKKERE